MLNFRKTIILASLFLFFILVSAGGASGKVLYNDTISEGDGYQINDYVIDVAEVFPSQESAIIQIYEGDAKDPKYDKLISEDGSFEFEIEGEDVELTVISVYSGVIPQAKLLITVTDDDFINSRTLGVVDGGHSEAEFSGTPVIEITKTVEPSTVDVGDTVTVKISAKNTGDDKATKVVFTDNIPPKFILEQTFVSPSGQISLQEGETRLVYTYVMKATEAGTYTFGPTTAIYSNSIDEDMPQASSNRPTVTVTGSSATKNASLDISMEVDKYTVDRNNDLQGVVRIKNTGDAPANAVTVKLIVPDGIEYTGGDSSIEVISGVPTIYLESFGVQQEKEILFDMKAAEEGTYTLTAESSYLFNNGVDSQIQEASSSLTTNQIYVTKGKYDHLFEQPVYVYLVPLVLIGAIAGWIYHRHKQYKF
ncbi:DUF11 domain-containing protein [Methanolobus zinderi]|uniref:DUF11 domain-containing protein n=1 Tax=Methanolobus zinderi TaxID=536044 RepID=A0A7D5E766_9EURY|nr:BatD family protein [Methanolobus zinderi]QLC49171.1 DUF11 domain-containing protein [Methanolobus zinderi]